MGRINADCCNDMQKLLQDQCVEPYYTAISFIDGEIAYKRVRFCFNNEQYPYWLEMESTFLDNMVYIRNAYNDDIIAGVRYEDNVQCADSLYKELAHCGIQNKEAKKIVYKLMIGDLPIERFLRKQI